MFPYVYNNGLDWSSPRGSPFCWQKVEPRFSVARSVEAIENAIYEAMPYGYLHIIKWLYRTKKCLNLVRAQIIAIQEKENQPKILKWIQISLNDIKY
jgi:hypothetical protein